MDFQVYYKIPFWLVENRWGKVFKDGCHPIAKSEANFNTVDVFGCISLIYLLFFCPSLTDFLVKKIWSLIRFYFVSMGSDSPFNVVQSISILSCYCFNLSTFFFFLWQTIAVFDFLNFFLPVRTWEFEDNDYIEPSRLQHSGENLYSGNLRYEHKYIIKANLSALSYYVISHSLIFQTGLATVHRKIKETHMATMWMIS